MFSCIEAWTLHYAAICSVSKLFIIFLGSLAMNRDGTDITLQDALDATNSFVLRDLKRPNMEDGPVGTVAPVHLPIEVFNDRPDKPDRVKHTFDVVGEIDFGYEIKEKEQVSKCFREDRVRDLPEPFGFKTVPEINVKVQIAVIPTQTPGKFYLLKHFVSEQQVKSMKDLCFGTAHTVTWGGR